MNNYKENQIPIDEGQEEAQASSNLLKDLEEQVKEKEDLYLRTLADFDNYRKRAEREKQESRKQTKKALLLDFLEIVDNLERAIDYEGEDIASLKEGVQAIYQQVLDIFKRNGVVSLESVGKKFDPRYHEAVGGIESEGFPSGAVGVELSKGYLIGDELLRPSRVRVVK